HLRSSFAETTVETILGAVSTRSQVPSAEAEHPIGVEREEGRLLVGRAFRDELGVRCDEVSVRAEEAIDRPVATEEGATRPPQLDARQNQGAEGIERPPVIRHSES